MRLPLPVRVVQRFGYVPMLVGSDWPAEGAIGHLNPARKDAEQIGAEVEEAINQGAATAEACRALIRWHNGSLEKDGFQHAVNLARAALANTKPAGQTQGDKALALLRDIADTWGPVFDRYGQHLAPPVSEHGSDFIEEADVFTSKARDILAGKGPAVIE